MTKPDPKSRKAKAAGKPDPAARLREPTAAEAAAIEKAAAFVEGRPQRARAKVDKVSDDGSISVGQPHSDGPGWGRQITATFGTSSGAFADSVLGRLGNAAGDGLSSVTQTQYNAALALMGGIDPQNELEAAIGEQIIAAHIASLDFLRRARNNAGEYRDAAAAYANMASKVSRTMATHVETLSRLRSGGKQQVIVKHIYVRGDAYVGDNGQALFGNLDGLNTGALEGKGGQALAFAGLDHVASPPLRSQDPERISLPRGSGGGPEALPDARLRAGLGGPEGEGERQVSDGPAHSGTTGSTSPGPLDGRDRLA